MVAVKVVLIVVKFMALRIGLESRLLANIGAHGVMAQLRSGPRIVLLREKKEYEKN